MPGRLTLDRPRCSSTGLRSDLFGLSQNAGMELEPSKVDLYLS